LRHRRIRPLLETGHVVGYVVAEKEEEDDDIRANGSDSLSIQQKLNRGADTADPEVEGLKTPTRQLLEASGYCLVVFHLQPLRERVADQSKP
jgi:hypothetical protein